MSPWAPSTKILPDWNLADAKLLGDPNSPDVIGLFERGTRRARRPEGPPELNPVGRVGRNQALYWSRRRRTYLCVLNIRTKVVVRIEGVRDEARVHVRRQAYQVDERDVAPFAPVTSHSHDVLGECSAARPR